MSSKITGVAITKEQITSKANSSIVKYQKEFKEINGVPISRAMAVVKILELYSG